MRVDVPARTHDQRLAVTRAGPYRAPDARPAGLVGEKADRLGGILDHRDSSVLAYAAHLDREPHVEEGVRQRLVGVLEVLPQSLQVGIELTRLHDGYMHAPCAPSGLLGKQIGIAA